MKNTEKTMDKLVALCKGRGFIYPGSEIYGGLANTWDFGPLGVELKNNIKSAWRKKFIQECKYNVGLDSAILMNPQTWVASGHIGGFSDPLMDCKACKTRHRADNLIEDFDGTNCAGISPLSTGGSLIMASYTQESGCDEKEQQKLFGQLFMLSAGMVALVFILTLAGLLKFLG